MHIYLLSVPGWVHVCMSVVYLGVYMYCLCLGGCMSVVYLGAYISRVSFRGGGRREHWPPPRLTRAPLGTGRFVNDNSSLMYG